MKLHPDLILTNGKITTLDSSTPNASSISIKDGRILAVDDDGKYPAGPDTQIIDLDGHRVIPGLNDSHLHLIRGGLNYNMELRWDGIPSLADALRMLKIQAAATPPGQWVRVVGSWSEFQFHERRMPTLEELNEAAPDTPVFILHLYCRALLNRAALRACGYTKDTPNPPGGEIQRDKQGNPTGLLIARPNAMILYATLAKGPTLSPEHQLNSTRHFMRELNRLGVTSCIDAGGGFQNYPDDYGIIRQLHERGEMTVRIAYNLFTQKPKEEKEDFARWMTMTKPGEGDEFFRMNGAGEMLVFSAADFEDFLEPRPDLSPTLETELEQVVLSLASNKWPFRLHATYDESITRFLDVFERVHREAPIHELHWFLDHCETISDRNLERVKALGGGIAIQHRMAFQGEYFVDRYGAKAAERTPPVRRMLEMGIPVGAGTDATRVASYNSFNSLYWLVSGRTLGGLELYPEANRMNREEALRLYTAGSAWFSGEESTKGTLAPGQLADIVVTSEDYFTIPEDRIRDLQSILTIVGGKPVYASGPFQRYDAPPIPILPEWSPVAKFGGYGAPNWNRFSPPPHQHTTFMGNASSGLSQLWGSGCDCFAF
ncbi:amidohydrolase [Luteolibacter pohnpeiensis]|uniref:Amidohydrolase n=1 Tax=Luteolibacter pohnpeiensis TaxID=454153 RepID=A0A934VPR9_9BACT|nr:amidohydrolase [Luteolibacter pohnpeiensis]MBK1881316.1 amidohydrolase [Luteolibacter pohnpeiensis]